VLDRLLHAGDPTFIGWVNTLLYFVLAFKAYHRFQSTGQERLKRRLWLMLFLLFLSLGFNKQLDLHSDLINAIRIYVFDAGYGRYEYFIKLLVALFGAMILLWLGIVIKKYLSASIRRHKPIALGLFMLFFFVFCRLVAFDHLFSGRAQTAVEYYSIFFEFPSLFIILIGMFDDSNALH